MLFSACTIQPITVPETPDAPTTPAAQTSPTVPMPPTLPPPAPPERLEIEADAAPVEISGELPEGTALLRYIIAASEGQTLTVAVTSDEASFSLIIEGPSGNRWIPEMLQSDEGYTVSQELVAPETGDYLVNLGKGDHSASSNYSVTFSLQSGE